MARNEEKKRGKPGAKGVELFKEGKYEQAINGFSKFLKTMPDDENKKVALYNRGMSYHYLGQHDMALKDGEICQKIDPYWAKGYKCSGLALEALGKHKDAIDTFLNGRKMCGSLDESTDVILNPLIERLNLGIARNEEEYERKSLRPGTKGVELFKEGKYEEAINEFSEFLKTMPDDENKKVALYNRGMSYHSLGKHDMALKDGESCQKIGPCWVKGYKLSGLALEGLGKFKDAIDTFLNGQKMCSSLDESTDVIFNPLIERLNLKIADDEIKSRKNRKCEKTGAKLGVELFKDGKYKEAITEFTTYLKTERNNRNKKVAHYNRGMAHNKLGQRDSALEDGEECIKIDPFWAKGYKCKGLALEGMGRLRDAEETFLDGKKMCSGHDQNAQVVLHELVKRLNRVTGLLKDDLDLLDRKKNEKYCISCNLFEKDVGKSIDLDNGKMFISCERCKMINYCCQRHLEEDSVTHSEICEELLEIRKNSEKEFVIQILPKEGALVLLALKPKGPKGQQLVNLMGMFNVPLDVKNSMDYLTGNGNLMPLYELAKFKPITKTQQKQMNTWKDLFTMLHKRAVISRMTTDLDKLIGFRTAVEEGNRAIKRTLTYVLTDAMTVVYAMKNVNLLNNGDEDKVIKLHIVGAEPNEEILKIKIFLNTVTNLTRRKLNIVFIGPLLLSPPGQVQIINPAVTLFRGTYQDYILTSDYEKPDFIVAFFPGLYHKTYNWLPAVIQAIAKKVPFLVTCDGKEDHHATKEWLMKGTYMKPKIIHDRLNPFGSWQAAQDVPGSNSVSKRNMFSLLIMGGDLGALRPLLQVEDEKFELIRVLFRFLREDALSDIMELKKSGKI